MKYLIIILIVSFIPFKSDASDMSGGCSSHGGIYLGIGSNSDGSVLCNDGWVNSSVLLIPQPRSCATQNDLAILQVKLNQSGQSRYTGEMAQGSIKDCQDSIVQYQQDLIIYNANLQQQYNWAKQAKEQWKQQQIEKITKEYQEKNDQLEKEKQEIIAKSKQECEQGNGIFSIKDNIVSCNKKPSIITVPETTIIPDLPTNTPTETPAKINNSLQKNEVKKITPTTSSLTSPLIDKEQLSSSSTQSLPEKISKPSIYHRIINSIRNFFRKIF